MKRRSVEVALRAAEEKGMMRTASMVSWLALGFGFGFGFGLVRELLDAEEEDRHDGDRGQEAEVVPRVAEGVVQAEGQQQQPHREEARGVPRVHKGHLLRGRVRVTRGTP